MKAELSGFQKAGALICCIIIIVGLVFGILTKLSFSDLTKNEENILNAAVLIDNDTAVNIDEIYANLDFESALSEFENSSCIFKIQCISSEICYNCVKHTVKVTDTIKGSVSENSNNIILYQWGGFEKAESCALVFDSFDGSMPLKAGCEYIVCAEKQDYYEPYQKTLAYNEYSLSLYGSAPTAYVINDVQVSFVNTDTAETFADIQDLYYLCYSQKSLDNINSIAAQIIAYYLPEN